MMVDAKSVLLVLGGAATAFGLKKAYDYGRGSDEDLDDEMTEIYLEKGSSGLARWLKREGHAEDRDEALEMVADFEDENEDVVNKYTRKQARKDERDQLRAEREKARMARSGRNRSQPATA